VQAIDVTRGVRPSRPVLKAAWLASVTVVAVGTGAPALAQPRAAAVDGWAARSGVKPWTEPVTPIGGRR